MQMTNIIGKGAYDAEGHINTKFLEAQGIGPYPREMRRAWIVIREDAIANYGIEGEEGTNDWNRLGPSSGTHTSNNAKRRSDRKEKSQKGGSLHDIHRCAPS